MIAPDSKMRPLVTETMKGNLILNDDETEESIIEEYFNHRDHYNYVTDEDANGFLCVSVYNEYVVVNFAWHIGTFGSQKKMVQLGKQLHYLYTVGHKKPIYYSGKKNLYPNHSITIAHNVWQFIV